MFDKILVANRGEIAVRLIRACRELGIRTVAVYSEADRSALHVRLADEARLLGPAVARESYLSIAKVIQAARDTGAQAIHPGYGFLSENADFAEATSQAGLTFIGPPSRAIRTMGDKGEARKLMQSRRVPVVPGYQDLEDDSAFSRAADEIGYPVLVKATAGGGGKAMRIVRRPNELFDSIDAARREAAAAFGDERLLLEKYLGRARHIEFQVLADRFGRTLHLFERECSVQRRHQKIIEETPSPLLDDGVRRQMGEAAVEAARAVGYENAGTVEFIVDPETRQFYFLEMNTRLQVEHPITELTTGLDLVQWQIRIASGQPLTFTQDAVWQRGHAIECRVYAEDPENGFLPATGCLLCVVEPRGPGTRVDTGVSTGDQVALYYDPLLAKLCVLAENREAAIRRMQNALHDYVLLGVRNNIQFLQAVLAHPEFQAGRATTTFIETELGAWRGPERALPREALIAAALGELTAPGSPAVISNARAGTDPYSPWRGL